MADLSQDDAARYPDALLADAESKRHLIAGLKAARRLCGWHVTGVWANHVVTMNGPGSALLALPTLRLGELTSVVENGVDLDVANELDVSPEGLVEKCSGAWWSRRLGSVVVTMTHGIADAEDFDAAVVSFVKRNTDGRRKVVGPFQYELDAMDPESAFSIVERSMLNQYRLERRA